MKNLFILLLSFCTIVSLSAENSVKDKMRKNKVKSQIQWSYKYIKGKPSKKGSKISKTWYDAGGNVTKKVNYNRSGEETLIMTYKYDENGKKILFESYDVGEKATFKQTFVYQGENKVKEGITEITNISGNTSSNEIVITYKYDDKGRLKEVKKKDAVDFSVHSKWIYSYTDNSENVKEYDKGKYQTKSTTKIFDGSRNVVSETIDVYDYKTGEKRHVRILISNKYDKKNRLLEMIKIVDDSFTEKLIYTYDQHDNVTKISKETPVEQPYVNNKYEYDKNLNLKKESWYEGKNIENYSKKTLRYDKRNNLVETTYFYARYNYQILYKYTYEFY